MDAPQEAMPESDPRFPSGSWTGFFLQHLWPGRSRMKLEMSFRGGRLEATGADRVGAFTFEGSYNAADGSCRWRKQYLGKHQVSYTGKSEGAGIWGVWELRALGGWFRDQGVFHLWPEGMESPDESKQTEQAFLQQPGAVRLILPLILLALLIAGAGAGAIFLILQFRFPS